LAYYDPNTPTKLCRLDYVVTNSVYFHQNEVRNETTPAAMTGTQGFADLAENYTWIITRTIY